MKARIVKKLSKKLAEASPKTFPDTWVCEDIIEEAWEQGSRVSHCLHVGGGVDYWGEGQDAYTVLECMKLNWEWIGKFKSYPKGHEFEGYPDTRGFKPTSRNLLRLARECG